MLHFALMPPYACSIIFLEYFYEASCVQSNKVWMAYVSMHCFAKMKCTVNLIFLSSVYHGTFSSPINHRSCHFFHQLFKKKQKNMLLNFANVNILMCNVYFEINATTTVQFETAEKLNICSNYLDEGPWREGIYSNPHLLRLCTAAALENWKSYVI